MVIRLPTNSHTVELSDKAAAAFRKPWNDSAINAGGATRMRRTDALLRDYSADPIHCSARTRRRKRTVVPWAPGTT